MCLRLFYFISFYFILFYFILSYFIFVSDFLMLFYLKKIYQLLLSCPTKEDACAKDMMPDAPDRRTTHPVA